MLRHQHFSLADISGNVWECVKGEGSTPARKPSSFPRPRADFWSLDHFALILPKTLQKAGNTYSEPGQNRLLGSTRNARITALRVQQEENQVYLPGPAPILGPPNSKCRSGCSNATALACSHFSYTSLPLICLLSTVFFKWMRAIELHYNVDTSYRYR